jgi:hypothetical protein
MADGMANYESVVITAITLNVIAGIDSSIHHLKAFFMKFDGYAGQARV